MRCGQLETAAFLNGNVRGGKPGNDQALIHTILEAERREEKEIKRKKKRVREREG